MLWLLPLVPLAGAALVLLVRRRSAMLASVAVGALLGTLAASVWAAMYTPVAAWPWWGPHLTPELAVVGLGRVMVVLIPVIAIPVVLYTAATLRGDGGLPRLLALLVAFVGAMELLVLAADFLTLLIAWELVGACSWGLIGYDWRDASRPRAARDAFLTTRSGDLGLYVAAAATVAAAGSVRFDALASVRGPTLDVVAAGVLLAAAAKSAQLPFSPWLFSAMAGPTPASALLHSATMVAAGAYLLAQLAPVLAPVGWFAPVTAALGLGTAIAGGVIAALQSDFKRALAASTSAQYGLMFVAVGAGVPAAAGVHLVTHAAFKALLFLGAGIALHAAGTGDLGVLRHVRLGSALPRVAALVGVGILALAAVPPLGGAYSKELVLSAALHGPFGAPWLAIGVLVAGFLSALYAVRLQLLVFGSGNAVRRPRSGTDPNPPAGLGHPRAAVTRAEIWSLGLLSGLSVLLGLLWLPGSRPLAERIVDAALVDGAAWEIAASLGTIVLAAALCWRFWRREALLTFGLSDAVRAPVADWLALPWLARRGVVTPALALASALATVDDRVVDAGVRTAARIGRSASHLFAWWTERGIDGLVMTLARATDAAARAVRVADDRGVDGLVVAVARATDATARASRVADDRGLDGAVEGIARQVGAGGRQSRRLQTGLAHHYYVLLAVGALVVVVVAAAGLWLGPSTSGR